MTACHIDLKDLTDRIIHDTVGEVLDESGVALIYELRRRRPEGFVLRDQRVGRELQDTLNRKVESL